MTLFFRLILIAVSVLNFFYMARKLRKSHVEGRDTIFWMLFSVLLIVLSLFPGIANALAGALGVYSPENVVFLLIIFALLIKLFFLSVKHSQLEFKVQVLAEEHAADEDWAQAAVSTLSRLELLPADAASLDADAPVTRRTACELLCRAMQRMED